MRAVEFVRSIGLDVREGRPNNDPAFNPDSYVWVHKGILYYDPEKFHVGDFLHEAGHLAVLPSIMRPFATGDVEESVAHEIAEYLKFNQGGLFEQPEDPIARACIQCGDSEAIAWSYAAAVACGVDTDLVFENGFQSAEDRDGVKLGCELKVDAQEFMVSGRWILRERQGLPEDGAMAGSLTYVKGDATEPAGTGPKLIPHVCNTVGGWGAGFVVAISRKWGAPEESYRRWHRSGGATLGWVQPVMVEPDLWVINMIGQEGVGRAPDGTPPIRYEALRVCLGKVARIAESKGASIHAPKFGSALAGGSWSIIESIAQEELVDRGLDVSIDILPSEWIDGKSRSRTRELIECACGCGTEKLKYRSQGRLASPYMKGHRPRPQKSDDDLYPTGDRHCRGCSTTKPLEDFGRSKDKNGRHYVRSRCKQCNLNYQKDYAKRLGEDYLVMPRRTKANLRKKDPIRYHIQEGIARYRAQTPGRGDLTTAFLVELWARQNGQCFLTGTPMIMGGIGNGRPNPPSASLDRLDPKKGYVQGNVAWCSYQANTSKGSRTLEEFYEFCELILERAGRR